MFYIDFPTTIKDGPGWGAFTGYSVAILAQFIFTRVPVILIEAKLNDKMAASELADRMWSSLVHRWEIKNMVYKFHALCAWIQAAAHGVRKLRDKYNFASSYNEIVTIDVESFNEALFMTLYTEPKTTVAQYSLPFAAVITLIHGLVAGRETCGDALLDENVAYIVKEVLEIFFS